MLPYVEQPRVAFARWCSDIASPPVLTILTIAVVADVGSRTERLAAVWTLSLALIVAGVPVLYVLWLVRRGAVSDLHLPLRRERLGPMVATLLAGLGAILFGYLLAAPLLLQRLLGLYTTQALVLGVVTLRWKISFHAAAAGFFVGVALALDGREVAPLVGVLPLVAWARLTLRRHTPRQIIAGALLGLLSAAFFV